MGLGGTSSQHSVHNPSVLYSPVSYGGNIVSGDIGTGAISSSHTGTAGGGDFGFDLKIPEIPGLGGKLINLDSVELMELPALTVADMIAMANSQSSIPI